MRSICSPLLRNHQEPHPPPHVIPVPPQVEHLIKQNNALDIYEEYFSGTVADHSSEQPYARTLTVFRDPSPLKRSASYISWHPDGARAGGPLNASSPPRHAASQQMHVAD